MPSLVTSAPRDLQPHNMDNEEERQKICKTGILTSRLCMSPQMAPRTAVAKGLCPEEMVLWSQSLERLLASKYGTVTFQAFLKSEFSDENIEFWQVCEDYKKIRSSLRMSCRAKKIYKRYIQAEAPREINIDHRTRDLIRRNMKTPTALCFNAAQAIVYGLMERDSYPRFLRSDLYRALLNSKSDYNRV